MSADMVPRFAGPETIASALGESTWLRFASLCESLAATRSKLAKRSAIAGYLATLDAQSAGQAAQFLTGTVYAESDARKVMVGSRLIIHALETITGTTPERFHTTYRKYGDLGATAAELLETSVPHEPALRLSDIAAGIDALSMARTQVAKSAQLADMLRKFSPIEARYFVKLLLGDMRMGVKQTLVEEAIAAAAHEELASVRRAETMLGNLPAVVALAWSHTLATARFQMFHALGFMLATPATDAEDAFARVMGAPSQEDVEPVSAEANASAQIEKKAQIEDKYDGMRAQIHCGDPSQPGRVRIFSRTREDVTASFPELAEWFAAADKPAILDGEILAWDFEADRARPFTALQSRLGRKRVTQTMKNETQVVYMAFDMLLSEETLLLDLPLAERRKSLENWTRHTCSTAGRQPLVYANAPAQSSLFVADALADAKEILSRLKVAPVWPALSPAQIDEAFSAAQARGNEGLMLKSLASVYQPGRRGSAWLKLKRELATLDVLVTAVEYGHGRRAAVLSDYTFAVRDGDSLRNVGKAYSGLTDIEIENLTQWFLDHTLDERDGQFLVEPKIVLEVAFNNVMESERHKSGYSLRFPRIVRIRTDKPVGEIDTLDRVAELFRAQHKGLDRHPATEV